MHPRALELQEIALNHPKKDGDAECFLRRRVATAVCFEGARLGPASEVARTELAVRLLCSGREGVTGGSLPHNEDAARALAERAAEMAPYGRKLESLRVDPAESEVSSEVWGAWPEAASVVAEARQLAIRLQDCWPHYFWSGTVEQIIASYRVRNRIGLSVSMFRSICRWSVRGRRMGVDAPVDRLLEAEADSWDAVANGLLQRMDGELPRDEGIFDAPPGRCLVFGVGVVARLLEALTSRPNLAPSVLFHPSLSILDHPLAKFDEEGIRTHPLTVVGNGRCELPWRTLGAIGVLATGRAYRPAVENPPRVRAGFLNWREPIVSWPERAVLIPELAALTLRNDGLVTGTAIGGVLLEHGRPVARCRAPVVRLPLQELLGTRLIGGGPCSLSASRHLLPPLILN